MTAPIRSSVTIFASALIAAGGTKTAPASGGTGAWVDVRGLNGGKLAWLVQNGSSTPGVQGQFTFQVADDSTGTNATDLWTGGGDTVANNPSSGIADLPAEASYVRMLCYGNTTNAVTFKGTLFAKA